MRAPSRLRAAILAVAVAGGSLAAALTLGAAPAGAATVSDCTPWGMTTMQSGGYEFQQNEWNSTSTQCSSIDTDTGAWSLTQANFGLTTAGAPATYPSTFKGCHWGECTANSGLPIQVSKLGSATSSWSTTQVGSGAYDVAYDIWFNSTPTTIGQPDGTEMMIWLNSRGGVQPFGSQTATTNAAGHSWNVWTGQQSSWKIISYVLQGGATSVSDLDIKALTADSVARGSLNASNYLIDAEVGFEVWQGGQGLASNSFSFTASESGGGTGGDTTPPSTPTGLSVTGTTASSASLSWSPSTDNTGVTGYDVYRGGTLVGSPSSTGFTDSGLTASTAYSYTVRAHDAAGNASPVSAAVTATTASGGGGTGNGCAATLHVDNDWGAGFTATVTVTNSGAAATHGWQVGWNWPGSQQITNSWNATVHQSGAAVTAGNAGYNGTVAPHGSTTFGFQGTSSGSTPALTCTAS